MPRQSTRRHLEEMQQRVGKRDLLGPASDPKLSEQKQRQIVEGASKVLFAKGFHGTSIRDIAAACDMSMGQLYHYISSKDDILYLMHLHSQELWHQHLADGGFEKISDPVAKLEHALRISLKYLSDTRQLIRFIYTESKYMDEQHLREALDLDDQNVVGFYRHLLAGIPGLAYKGREAELAANLVAFMLVFLPMRGWNLHFKSEDDVQAAIDFLVDFMFRGLGLERPAEGREAS